MTYLVKKLERVFLLNLLCQWLKWDEVAKLDTAFTTTCQRHAFLELLSKCNCKSYMNGFDLPFGQFLIEWMTRRNIPFHALTVSSDTLNSSTIDIFGSETLTSLSCSHFWQQEQNFGDSEVVSPVNRIFSSIPNLSDIKLTNSKFVTGHNATINCPHLTSCDFTFLTKLTDDFVVNLSQKCPQLTRVVLSQCKLLTDTSIFSLVKSCKALSFLHIGGCKKLTAVTLQSIASECSQLTGFNMDYWPSTTQLDPTEKSHEDLIIDIVRSNTLLTELYVKKSGITNKTLNAIAKCLLNFRVLDFSDGQVTDDGLVSLAESCKLLSELVSDRYRLAYIIPAYRFTQKTFLAIAANCPEFKRFRLPSELITKEVLAVVSMDIDCVDLSDGILDCSHFRSADRANDAIDGETFKLLGPYSTGAHTYRCDNLQTADDNVLFLENMPDVKHLDLVSLGVKLTDKQLRALSKHLTKLESVVFYSRKSDTSRIFDAAYSNNALLALTENNPLLTKLDIGRCVNLTDEALAKISEHCRGLKWLNIYHAKKVSDEGFLSLAKNCPRLQYLDARGCISLTELGIRSVIGRCKELQTFLFLLNSYRFQGDFDLQVKSERYEMHFEVEK